MKYTLVVGGAGFIGTHLIEKLKLTGVEILVVDAFVERVHGSEPQNFHQDIFKIDSRDSDAMATLLKGRQISEIYFLASDTSTGSSLAEIDVHVSQNTTALAGLLKALSFNKQIPERIVLTSSRAVYGEGHEVDPHGLVTPLRSRTIEELSAQSWLANHHEGCKFEPNYFLNRANPNNVYGLTKLFQEDLLAMWCRANNALYNIYRLQNVIGPGQNPRNPYSGVITNFCVQAIAGERLQIFEGGEIIRDFVHVKDVVDVLQIPLKDGFNYVDIGTGRPTKLHTIAKLISEICEIEEPELTYCFRIGDVGMAYANPKSLDALSQSWQPRQIGREALAEILSFVRNNIAKI